ncbi:MAG: 16S rRNA (guanine(527)-N(7))-methyltransferase RsmG [Chloroflexi bacterium]|nr:16S rRNA (guanine(527)-N(7))-methyltransferase RsmG [Chloroflexota bacterium]
MQLQRLAENAAQKFEVELSPNICEQLATYAREMLDWNENRANLTAITDPDAVETRHFLDSISLFRHIQIPQNARLIDVGTGAGFPGLVLKIIRPDIVLTLMDSVGKKTAFLSQMVEVLQLANVQVVTSRAEDAGRSKTHREKYDVVVARAVAHLPVLSEYLLPLCKVGGICVAMKGESAAKEINEATYALKTLGGKVVANHRVELPGVDEAHYLIVIEKIRSTPAQYPRQAGTPSKHPLLPQS